VEAMRQGLKPEGDMPVVLVSHGPPRGDGNKSIDVISDRTNVGDEAMRSFINGADIKYGIFGHILESGGRAVGGDIITLSDSDEATAWAESAAALLVGHAASRSMAQPSIHAH
ncbi:MAG: hypothetical protein AAFX94_25880, partial [Myxococcota bacterium]